MSQVDNLLSSLTEEEIAALYADASNEPHIVIGSDRYISVPDRLKRIAVQHDHNIETVVFDCPRYWDGHDMSLMKVYINYMRSDGSLGAYIADSVIVDENDDTIMHFMWTISGYVTEVKGTITFLVCIKTVDTEGNPVQHWNSELNREMYVSEGLECGSELYPDVITQILVVADRANNIAAALEEHLANNDFTLGLPIVTEEDDGKILRVSNGEWTADPLEVYEGDTLDGYIIVSPSGTQYKLVVSDDGALSAEAVTE